MRWTVLRPPAGVRTGDRELLPLFRCIARGFAPLPAGMPVAFRSIYVDDLATAVLRWLELPTPATARRSSSMTGIPGGYDWDTVVSVAGRVLREGAPVRRLPIPVSLLDFAAAGESRGRPACSDTRRC